MVDTDGGRVVISHVEQRKLLEEIAKKQGLGLGWGLGTDILMPFPEILMPQVDSSLKGYYR